MAGNKYTDLDSESDRGSKWKNKYLSSLEELEVKEKQWGDSEKNLRALITHLTNAADTSSLKLNEQLSVLRDAINKGIAANKLKKAIDEVADSILGLEAIREKKKRESSNHIVELIGKIKPAGKIEAKLSKLSGKIAKTSTNREISPFLNDLAKLLVHGLSLAEEKKDKGFLSSLLSKKEKDDKEPEIKIEQSEVEGKIESGLNLDNAVKSLISLLEKMALPDDLQVEVNLIQRKLSQPVDEKIFLSSLEQTVGITADVLGRVKKEKAEIEDFLKQLTGRLNELDKDIRETARIRELTHLHGKEMTDVMKTEMSTIENGINNINNLDELKTSIQSRVINLRNHVDNFLIKENEKDKQAASIIEKLKKQVKVMEDEAEELKEQIEKERQQTLRDVLTEIPNRLAYDERLNLELANFRRKQDPFTLVVWDIDLFKKVNDTYGHAAGDQVLKLVASILNKNIRETDFIARYGGEEFVSILPDTDIKGAQLITDKLRETIASSKFHFRDEAVNVTVSSGFAEVKNNEDSETLFIRADKALYKAKENGRNNCQAAL
ncbi:MAG: diguanylate cyclase [Gammaproteobacteria bacterium]|nr:diguanylate cyclase [Gammaproteobacteria bacterium]